MGGKDWWITGSMLRSVSLGTRREERRGFGGEKGERDELITSHSIFSGVYDDRKESFVRDEIVGKKEEVDQIAAS